MKEKFKSLGYLITKASKTTKWDLSNRLTDADLGLTASQFAVIKDIEVSETMSSDTTPAEIAKRLNSDRPTVSGILERLVKQGWVYRVTHPEDRRSHFIKLTDKAKENLGLLEELSNSTMEKALEGFKEDELQNLMEYLGRVIRNLS